MLFEIKNEKFLLEREYKNAFEKEKFEEKYIEECFQSSAYIVGDISSGILRLKGFNTDPASENYFENIDQYLNVSCALGCAFFVLKKVGAKEFEHLKKAKNLKIKEENFLTITPMEKESFDKDTLLLESNPRRRNLKNFHEKKINIIPATSVSAEVLDFIKNDKNISRHKTNNKSREKEKEKETTTYVSASPDFVPNTNSKYNKNKKKKNNNQNK